MLVHGDLFHERHVLGGHEALDIDQDEHALVHGAQARDVRVELDEKSGAGRPCSAVKAITSETLSTTMPTTRPAMFRMMTTVNWS